jgi:2,4-dienoyl-CoA reductase-like NADH-dependent reductase (Old Yellow Enzyme family)
MPSLFDPYDLGPIRLANRIVMAPMTRSRVRNAALAPDSNVALYYAQRAGAGLIVTEGVPISVEGRGWAFTPGIYTPEQIAGWRGVTDAVHAKGGVIFAQIWHNGRASHVSHQKDRRAPVSSVDTQAHGVVSFAFDDSGEPAFLPQSKPRALKIDEISRLTNDFVQAARNAMAAGFDGIELHAANGYVFEQFINGALNTRDDRYGGAPVENRLRFTLETVDAVTAAIGGERTGIRLSPFGRYNDMHPFEGEAETWLTLAAELSNRALAYVHISDQTTLGERGIAEAFLDQFRQTYSGTLIVAGGYVGANGQAALDAGRADQIAIGRPFISNPDLVERLRNGWPLTEPDRATFYQGGDRGYIDYPTCEAGGSRLSTADNEQRSGTADARPLREVS